MKIETTRVSKLFAIEKAILAVYHSLITESDSSVFD